jgi:hypothetical protein
MGRRGSREARARLGRRRRRAQRQVPRLPYLVRRRPQTELHRYKLLFTDIVDGRHVAVPHAIIAAGNIMQGAHGGIDIPESDITRAKNHLAKYYKIMGETAPRERD